jgi:hypothetical protein
MTGYLGPHTLLCILTQIEAALGVLAPSPIRAGLADARRTLLEASIAPVTVLEPAPVLVRKIVPGAARMEMAP